MIIPKEISFRQKLYDHIKLREGYKNVVYLDTLGKPTGGIGHLLSAEEKKLYPVGCPLKESVIKEWYDNDIQKSLDACNEQCKILNVFDTEFKIALTSVNFQLGTKWFRKFPAAWKALCHREYDKAIDEITNDKYDLIAVGRALLSDHEWVLKMKEGRVNDVIPYTKEALLNLY